MKKIAFMGAALLTFLTGFAQSHVSLLGTNDPVVYSSSTTTSLLPCTEENPNDGTFEEGVNCSSASAFLAANDLTVNADENFTLSQITASIFANNGIASVDVKYYDDANGIPGAVIGSEVDLVPTTQAVIGSNFGFDVNEIVVDVTPFQFTGQTNAFTRYWIELSVTDGGTTPNVFWVATSSSAVGEPIIQFNTFWSFPNTALDGVYIWAGDCGPLLGVLESLENLISIYPNPTTDSVTIDLPSSIEVLDLELYDVLGNDMNAVFEGGTVDMNALSRGVYLMRIVTSDGSLVKKIIKN